MSCTFMLQYHDIWDRNVNYQARFMTCSRTLVFLKRPLTDRPLTAPLLRWLNCWRLL